MSAYAVMRDRRAIVTRHTQGTLLQQVGSVDGGVPVFEPIATGDYFDICEQASLLEGQASRGLETDRG